jgi:predicted metalloprotease with PDZ domain
MYKKEAYISLMLQELHAEAKLQREHSWDDFMRRMRNAAGQNR